MIFWIGLALVGLFATSAHAIIYKYADHDGVTHYSDSIASVPFEYRDQVRDISNEMDDLTGFRVVDGLNEDSPGADARGEKDFNFDFGGDLDPDEMAEALIDKLGLGIILLVLLALPLLYVISASILKLACRIAGTDPPSLGRACGILFAQGIAGAAVGGATAGLGFALGIDETASIVESVVLNGASSVISWLASAGILTAMMGYGFLRSLWVGILHTILLVVLVGGPIVGVLAIFWLAS